MKRYIASQPTMVLKQERRVNAASVAKRQSISAAAAQKKLEIEEAAREVALQKAWSVGADERSRRRQDEENQRETRRAEKQQAKDEALRNDDVEGPSLVKPRRAHSSDDLLGLALMQQAAEKRLKARRKKPNSPPRTPSLPRLNSCDDMLDVSKTRIVTLIMMLYDGRPLMRGCCPCVGRSARHARWLSDAAVAASVNRQKVQSEKACGRCPRNPAALRFRGAVLRRVNVLS